MSQSIPRNPWASQLRTTRRCLAALVLLLSGAGCTGAANDTRPGATDAAAAADAAATDAAAAAVPYKPCGVEERAADGTLLAFVYRGYDDRGNHVLSERDTGRDGTVDDRFTWQYAPGGGLARATWQFASGRMVELNLQYGADDHRSSASWSGYQGQGSAAYEYLDNGQSVVERWDRDDDGVAEETRTYTYSPDGILQGHVITCGDSVDPVVVVAAAYTGDGRILRTETHRNGELIHFMDFSYNGDGTLSRVDVTLGGELVRWESYQYDRDGDLTERTVAWVLALGEQPPSWSVSSSVYDAEGRLLRSESSINGRPSMKNIYVYECPGYQDSPGRWMGKNPVRDAAYQGPLGKAGQSAVAEYALAVGECRSAVAPGMAQVPRSGAAPVPGAIEPPSESLQLR